MLDALRWHLRRWRHGPDRWRAARMVVCVRRSDGSIWASHCPQSFAYAMRALVTGIPTGRFHFAAAKIIDGRMFVSPKTFWLPADRREFISVRDMDVLIAPPLPEEVECRKIDRITGLEPPEMPTPQEVGSRIRVIRM